MTEVFDGQNTPLDTPEDAVAEEKLRSKLVYVDGPAIAGYLAETKNKTMPAGVHPKLYAASAQYTYEKLRDGEEHFRDSEAGRICVKPGGLTELVRQSVAKFIGYTGELTLASSRVTNAEKIAADAVRGTAATVFMFAILQAQGDDDALEQNKRTAFALIKKKAEQEAPNMVLTDDDLETMWTVVQV